MNERNRPESNTHREPELDTTFDPSTFEDMETTLPAEEPSPFDNLDNIRVDHHFLVTGGTSTALTTIRVRRPHREWFVRTHPEPSYRVDTGLLILDEDNEAYYVTKPLWHELFGLEAGFALYRLRLAVSRQGTPFLWPVRLPDEDGKRSSWADSAEQAAERASYQWVRLQADRQMGGYRVLTSPLVSPPVWPALSFQELLKIAFRQKVITSLDHLVLRRLRGEA